MLPISLRPTFATQCIAYIVPMRDPKTVAKLMASGVMQVAPGPHEPVNLFAKNAAEAKTMTLQASKQRSQAGH